MSSVLDYTLPVRWKETRLENLISQGSNITYGVVQPGPEDERGVPFVRGGDIYNGTIAIDKLRTISKDISNSYSRTLLEGGELLMSLVGYPGEVAIVPSELAGANIARQAAYVKLAKNVDNKYVMYYLLSDIGKFFLFQKSTGSAQQVINLVELKEVNVILPPLAQQKKIAKILSTVDNLIEKTQALIEKYTAIKQGMMSDLFTRGIDLSGTTETNPNYGQLRPSYGQAPELYKQTELGWVPKEWEVSTLEGVSVSGFKNGYFKDPKLLGRGMKLVNVSELYQDFGIDITPEKVERILISPKDYQKYKIETGDIFFTRSSLVLEGIAKSNIIRSLPEEAIYECHVMRLKPNCELVVPEFLAIYSGMPVSRAYLMSMAKQVTMTTIAQPDMVGLPVPIPTIEEQSIIVSRIDAIEILIRKETSVVNKHKQFKKGLMQDLLTGKIKI